MKMAKKKTRRKTPKARLMPGLAYKHRGRGSWKKADDWDWEDVVVGHVAESEYLGTTVIDGERAFVFKVDGRRIYAQVQYNPTTRRARGKSNPTRTSAAKVTKLAKL
jgi:hypothetical protein